MIMARTEAATSTLLPGKLFMLLCFYSASINVVGFSLPCRKLWRRQDAAFRCGKASLPRMGYEGFSPDEEKNEVLDRLSTPRKYGNRKALNLIDFQGPISLKALIDEGSTEKGLLSSSLSSRFFTFLALFIGFPFLEILAATFYEYNPAVTEALTGAFLPVTGVLFGTLASFTASYLLDLQNTIKEQVSVEVAGCVTLLRRLLDAEGLPEAVRDALLEQLWFHLITVAERTKQDELYLMLHRDPLLEMLGVLGQVGALGALGEADRGALLAELRAVYAKRQDRLSAEGESVPPVQTALLRFLGLCVGVGFLTLVDDRALALRNSGVTLRDVFGSLAGAQLFFRQYLNSYFELQLLFALLFSALLVADGFLNDLSDPFSGASKVTPRALTNVNFLQCQQLLVGARGADWLRDARRAYRRQSGEADRSRRRNDYRYEVKTLVRQVLAPASPSSAGGEEWGGALWGAQRRRRRWDRKAQVAGVLGLVGAAAVLVHVVLLLAETPI